MKRYIGLFLAMTIIFLLAACGQDANGRIVCSNCNTSIAGDSSFCANCGRPVEDYSSTDLMDKEDSNSTTDEHKHDFAEADCTNPAMCTCGETKGSKLGHDYKDGVCIRCGTSDPQYIVQTLVYQDSKVIIHFKKITKDGVVFEVENLTDVTITIQADAIALNHTSINRITMSDDVAPNSIGNVVAKCSVPDVGEIGVISGQLRVIDFNRSFDTYDAKFVDVIVNSNVTATIPEISSTSLYSDGKVKIYYKETTNDGVYFWIENMTDVVITIQAEAVSINKRSTDKITMSDEVAPNSVGVVHAKCSIEDVSSVVETVGGALRVIDFNRSFDTYEATFVNVPVQES